jgi:hypothetical protein
MNTCRIALKHDSLARHTGDSHLAIVHRVALPGPQAPDTDTRPEDKSQCKQPKPIS